MKAGMAIGRKLVQGLATVGLILSIGCAKNEGKDLADDGNSKIATARVTIAQLYKSYGIDVGVESYPSPSRFEEYPWNERTLAERAAIRQKLNSNISNCGRIVEIMSHKDVNTNGMSPAPFQSSISASKQYLAYLDRVENGQWQSKSSTSESWERSYEESKPARKTRSKR